MATTNETVVEIVKFTQQGIDEITARTKAMGAGINDASARMKVLSGLMNDPRYARHEQQLATINKQYELMSLRMRNVSAAQALADGSAAKQAKSVAALNREHELTQLKLRNVVAAQGLADGSTVRHIRDVERLNREHERTQRIAEYTARYGERMGGFLAKYGAALSVAGNAAALGVGVVAGTGVAMAKSGFQGTVEGNRFDFEMKRISRELAGIMLPVMEVMTKGARYIREKLEHLSESGQNVAMGGLLLGGAAAGTWALRSLMTGGIAARMIGLGGAGAGASAGAAAGGAEAAAGSAAGSILTRKALMRAGYVGAVGALAYSAATSDARRPDEKPSEYYSRMRARGESKLEAGLSTGGAAIAKIFGSDTKTEAQERTEAAEAARRRNVTLAGGGFEESGAGYERIQNAIASVGGDLDKSGEERRALIEAINRLNENLAKMNGRSLDRPGG